ncbi:MAG TPA: TrmH family RNA methyltransferase [Candidatus Babeliales bacterium]|nr:TrmH family RNA methyltransferase [Candidatus Babeliales bacterium]
MCKIVLVVHNVRSALNVGSILRTAEGLGVKKVYLSGYTPYPVAADDSRLAHHSLRTSRQIHKTALGAESLISWQQVTDIMPIIDKLRSDGYMIAALEQTANSRQLDSFHDDKDIALIVGNEVQGLERKVLEKSDVYLQIPMFGQKESFNVAVATGIALYHLRCFKR